MAGLLTVCVSNVLAYEYVGVLSRKLSEKRWQTLRPVLGKLLDLCQFAAVYYSWRPTSSDPGDDLVAEITTALAEREMTPPEKDLDSNTVALLQQRIKNATETSSKIGGDA